MVPLDHGERTAWLQNYLQLLQHGKWLLKMFQNKANENVVKGMRRKGQTENIGLAKGHVALAHCPRWRRVPPQWIREKYRLR